MFILQCYETFYRYFLSLYLNNEQGLTVNISTIVHSLLQRFEEIRNESDLETFRESATAIVQTNTEHYSGFTKFLDDLAEKQDTIQFWYDYLFQDCFPYLSLFTAVRYRNWDMRTCRFPEATSRCLCCI